MAGHAIPGPRDLQLTAPAGAFSRWCNGTVIAITPGKALFHRSSGEAIECGGDPLVRALGRTKRHNETGDEGGLRDHEQDRLMPQP